MDNSPNPKRILISILILPIIVLVIVFFYIGIVNKPKDLPVHEEAKPRKSPQGIFSGAELDLEDFTFTKYTKTDNGVEKSFVLSGKKLRTKNPKIGIFRIAIGKVVELEKPTITFYKNNLSISTASSKTGSMNLLNKSIDFYGNAGIITEDKRTLTCNKFKWDKEGKYLLAEGNCILKAEGKAIKAEVIKTDIELKDFDVVSKNRELLKTVTKLVLGGGRR